MDCGRVERGGEHRYGDCLQSSCRLNHILLCSVIHQPTCTHAQTTSTAAGLQKINPNEAINKKVSYTVLRSEQPREERDEREKRPPSRCAYRFLVASQATVRKPAPSAPIKCHQECTLRIIMQTQFVIICDGFAYQCNMTPMKEDSQT
jgi:hypothetical protein